MDFFHNTFTKNKILTSKKIKPTQYNYTRYINHILNTIFRDINGEIKIPETYPGAPRQAPFMGNGIYCFDNFSDCEKYQSGSVLTIEYEDSYNELDLDSVQKKLEIFKLLENEAVSVINNFSDVDDKNAWFLLLEIVRTSFYNNFKDSQPVVGILLHLLYEILNKDQNAIISKKFYDMIETDKEMKYYLIKDQTKICSLK